MYILQFTLSINVGVNTADTHCSYQNSSVNSGYIHLFTKCIGAHSSQKWYRIECIKEHFACILEFIQYNSVHSYIICYFIRYTSAHSPAYNISFITSVPLDHTYYFNQYTAVYGHFAFGPAALAGTQAFWPFHTMEHIMGFRCKVQNGRNKKIDLKGLYINCPAFLQDKMTLYCRKRGTYSTYPLIGMKRDHGSASNAGPGKPSPHPNLHCTAERNVGLHTTCNEEYEK